MWPPGRSSLVSIPSFSISICRKVLTFCRVSSSEYLQACRKREGCSPGFVPFLPVPLLVPQPRSQEHFPAGDGLSEQGSQRWGSSRPAQFAPKQPTNQLNKEAYQPNKQIN